MEIDNQIINHLLFHKALIDEENDMGRINEYIDVFKKARDKQNLSVNNSFDRSIYLAFDLVLNQQLNPWNIDLVNFSSLYLKRAREEKIDLITAGRIIYMAWKVLNMQSETLVIDMQNKQEELDHLEWDEIPNTLWQPGDDGYSYTNLVINRQLPPLQQPLRRDTKRKITLIELLDAFDIAVKDAEQYQIFDNIRAKERQALALKAKKAMKGAAHEDHLEEDIELVWKKIKQLSKNSIPLSSLCNVNDYNERIKTFLSILFLAYEKKIHISQKKFPFGEIYIKTLGYT
jgi:segregation and condensation protein A